MSETALVRLAFTIAGILIMGMSIPMMQRRVAPNPVYGLRIKATFADEWVWYEANARAAKHLFGIGLIIFLLALGLPLLPGLAVEDHTAIIGIFMLFAILIVFVIDVRYANRLLAERIARGAELKPRNPFARGPLKSIRRE